MDNTTLARNAWAVYQSAEQIYSANEVDAALDKLADACAVYRDNAPLLVCIMNGGLFTTAELAKRLDFPVQLDYLHATRYCGETTGGTELQWQAMPHAELRGRTIILVDDILDEGHTLQAVQAAMQAAGVKQIITVVLCQKDGTQKVPVQVDHVGLTVPNRYVFGSGMDYLRFLRNVPGIWAMSQDGRDD